MKTQNLFKFIPLAAAAAFTLSFSPLQAGPHGGGGGRGGGGHFGGGHAVGHFSGGHFHGGGHAFHGGGFNHFHDGRHFRGGFGFGLGYPLYDYPYYPYYGAYPAYGDDEADTGADSGAAYSDDAADNPAVPVQQALANAGYYHGPVDGVVGPATSGAIANYQVGHHLAVTGTINAQLLQSLGIN